MMVLRLIVDDISADGVRVASICEFPEHEWVDRVREQPRGPRRFGPWDILSNEHEAGARSPQMTVRTFPPDQLHVEDGVVHFEETWTIPREPGGGTLYSVVLPPGFVADILTVQPHTGPSDQETRWHVTPEGRLFTYNIYEPGHFFDIRARLKPDAKQHAEVAARAEKVDSEASIRSIASGIGRYGPAFDVLLKVIRMLTGS